MFSAREKTMSFDQIPTGEKAESASVITNDAVNMELLSTFEELQPADGSDLIVELIDLYLVDAAHRVSQIREAAIAAEWVSLKKAVHSLKGGSANLGILHVAAICEKLERLDSRDWQTVAVLVQLLEYESARAAEALAAVRQRRLD